MVHLRQPQRIWFCASLVLTCGLAGIFALYLDWQVLPSWLLAVNLIAPPLWAYDKWIAGRDGARIPESTLHMLAALGATPASFAAMSLLRHKTRKRSFYLIYAALLVAQVATWIMLNQDTTSSWFSR